MKKLIRLTTVLIVVFLIFSCSSDDDSNAEAPDSINQTEWGYEQGETGVYIYFSTDGTQASVTYPIYYTDGDYSSERVIGSFTYEKPNVTMFFPENCTEYGFIFSSCTVSGTINANVLTIMDNGESIPFQNVTND